MSNLIVQLPDDLLVDAQALAERERLTLQEYVVRMLSERVSDEAQWQRLMNRGQQVSRERFLEILRKAPNVPPMPGDELPE